MKIAYLFGVGASRNCLPIVDEIPSRLELMIMLLKTQDEDFFNDQWTEARFTYTKKELYNFLLSDFEWLLSHSREHASIDTFAKKLYIKGNSRDLRRLKVVLSAFFVLEQSRMSYDKRYDTFYASILTNSLNSFPKNVRILSWNYDFQFERALSEYSDQNDLKSNQGYLNVISKYNYRKNRPDEFSIIKLNGTSNFLDKSWRNNYEFCSSFETCVSTKVINEVLSNYALLLSSDAKLYCGLSFAWERFTEGDIDIIESAKLETADTEILIVIGYSFPYFNRDVDKEIITNMKDLKKVYFQSPQAEVLIERFQSLHPEFDLKNMVSRKDVGQFLLPNELLISSPKIDTL